MACLSGLPTTEASSAERPSLLLSFDVEDWHQLVHRYLGVSRWDAPGPALERQMATIFELLDELGANATFFVLGMTAKNHPGLVERIVARGCEVACHGYAHERVYSQTPEEFRADVHAGVELIERLTGRRPIGYRAPAFSINRDTPWAYEILADLGFRYDSSQHDSPRVPRRIVPVPPTPYRIELPSGKELWEFPIATWEVGGRRLPVGGGGYWRVLPTRLLLRALRELTRASRQPVLYFHPYELDPEPLRSSAPERLPAKQRLRALARSALRNPGRRRIPARIREVANEFRLLSYEEAYADIDRRYGACTRALSREGVLV